MLKCDTCKYLKNKTMGTEMRAPVCIKQRKYPDSMAALNNLPYNFLRISVNCKNYKPSLLKKIVKFILKKE